jgi:hypothetical protein
LPADAARIPGGAIGGNAPRARGGRRAKAARGSLGCEPGQQRLNRQWIGDVDEDGVDDANEEQRAGSRRAPS